MKRISLAILPLILVSSVSFAADHAVGGQDAKLCAQILVQAGIKPILNPPLRFVEAFDVFCEGRDFQNTCYASLQDVDPAVSRVEFSGPVAGTFWSLLRKAGLKNTIDQTSNGSPGASLISAGTVRCELDDGGGIESCSFDGS